MTHNGALPQALRGPARSAVPVLATREPGAGTPAGSPARAVPGVLAAVPAPGAARRDPLRRLRLGAGAAPRPAGPAGAGRRSRGFRRRCWSCWSPTRTRWSPTGPTGSPRSAATIAGRRHRPCARDPGAGEHAAPRAGRQQLAHRHRGATAGGRVVRQPDPPPGQVLPGVPAGVRGARARCCCSRWRPPSPRRRPTAPARAAGRRTRRAGRPPPRRCWTGCPAPNPGLPDGRLLLWSGARDIDAPATENAADRQVMPRWRWRSTRSCVVGRRR